MIWSEGDICAKLLGYIFKETYVHIFVLFNVWFFLSDSMIGNDRSLFTFF